MAGVGIAVLLIAYNNLLNFWPPFNRALYVPLNLAFAALLLTLAAGPLDLKGGELGLANPSALDVVVGVAIGVALSLPVVVAGSSERWRATVADERVKDLWGRKLAYQALVRVPLGTALLEEVAFRGVLFAAWRDGGTVPAAIAAGVVFGLWHIGPTINLVRANRPGAQTHVVLTVVAGAVAFTTAAGLALTWLRVATGGLGAPIAVHATVNSLSTVVAAFAHRRAQQL